MCSSINVFYPLFNCSVLFSTATEEKRLNCHFIHWMYLMKIFTWMLQLQQYSYNNITQPCLHIELKIGVNKAER